MSIKIIAIGNRLMGDDGIAIHVAEKLGKSFEGNSIEVIIGETDFQFCLSKIEDGDHLILVDATWFGIEPGTVTTNELKDIYSINADQSLFSQHGYSLIKALETCYKSVDGIIVGIEGVNFDFTLSLGREIEESYESICKKVNEVIWNRIQVLRKKGK
jgi:hydrogenase maturation protease